MLFFLKALAIFPKLESLLCQCGESQCAEIKPGASKRGSLMRDCGEQALRYPHLPTPSLGEGTYDFNLTNRM